MRIKTIKDIKKLKGQKILVRYDFDAPVKDGKVVDNTRLLMGADTLKYLTRHKAKVILVGHSGRPNGKRLKSKSLKPMAEELAKILKKKILFLTDCIGYKVQQRIAKMQEGDIVALENLRYYKEEEKNDLHFSKELANLVDIYVNESFGSSHRKHASMYGLTKYLPSFAGLHVKEEVINLSSFRDNPKRPLIVIIGGAKVATKARVIKSMLKKSDFILLGGVAANQILKLLGYQIGKSIVGNDKKIKALIKGVKLSNPKIKKPNDFVVVKIVENKRKVRTATAQTVKRNEIIFDIGPETIEKYTQVIAKAKTVIWSGPMGKFEVSRFSYGTKAIVDAIRQSEAQVILGGGDTVEAYNKFSPKRKAKNIYISMGGGAMLEFLEKGKLVAIEPLKK